MSYDQVLRYGLALVDNLKESKKEINICLHLANDFKTKKKKQSFSAGEEIELIKKIRFSLHQILKAYSGEGNSPIIEKISSTYSELSKLKGLDGQLKILKQFIDKDKAYFSKCISEDKINSIERIINGEDVNLYLNFKDYIRFINKIMSKLGGFIGMFYTEATNSINLDEIKELMDFLYDIKDVPLEMTHSFFASGDPMKIKKLLTDLDNLGIILSEIMKSEYFVDSNYSQIMTVISHINKTLTEVDY